MNLPRHVFWPAAICALLAGLFFATAYVVKQEPKLSTGADSFGVIFRKPYYRSWLLRWCDAYEMPGGKPVYFARAWDMDMGMMVFTPEMKHGYRLIPYFSHLDMRLWDEANSNWYAGPAKVFVRPNPPATNVWEGNYSLTNSGGMKMSGSNMMNIEAGQGLMILTNTSWTHIITLTNVPVKPTRWQLFKALLRP